MYSMECQDLKLEIGWLLTNAAAGVSGSLVALALTEITGSGEEVGYT